MGSKIDREKAAIRRAGNYLGRQANAKLINYGRGGKSITNGSIKLDFETDSPGQLSGVVDRLNSATGINSNTLARLDSEVVYSGESRVSYRVHTKEGVPIGAQRDAILGFLDAIPGSLDRK